MLRIEWSADEVIFGEIDAKREGDAMCRFCYRLIENCYCSGPVDRQTTDRQKLGDNDVHSEVDEVPKK